MILWNNLKKVSWRFFFKFMVIQATCGFLDILLLWDVLFAFTLVSSFHLQIHKRKLKTRSWLTNLFSKKVAREFGEEWSREIDNWTIEKKNLKTNNLILSGFCECSREFVVEVGIGKFWCRNSWQWKQKICMDGFMKIVKDKYNENKNLLHKFVQGFFIIMFDTFFCL